MTASHSISPSSHSPEMPKRPKGILKNSNIFTSPLQSTSPEKDIISPTLLPDPVENKELTLQNTLQNAGRRSSSTRRASAGRRLSGTSFAVQDDDNAPRLKWDEINLYLAEQEKTAKMKIDEPKTPWAPHYDPSQDDMETEAENRTLDAQDLVVDELDKMDGTRHKKTTKDTDIPDLELGEPEEEDYGSMDHGKDRITRERSLSAGEKHVVVDNEQNGEQPMTTAESQEKHRVFEERRKKHYEMKNIKDLLGHPEELDEMVDDDEDDEEGAGSQQPGVPRIPERFSNGSK